MQNRNHKEAVFRMLGTFIAAGAMAGTSQAATVFVSYHDFGEAGSALAGNLTTHTVLPSATTGATNPAAVELVRFADGVGTGVFITVAGTNGTDTRGGDRFDPPAPGDPADALFNGVGLGFETGSIFEGGNGGSGGATLTLTGLDPSLRYDLAFVGGRKTPADAPDRFTLSGVDGTPTNVFLTYHAIDRSDACGSQTPNDAANPDAESDWALKQLDATHERDKIHAHRARPPTARRRHSNAPAYHGRSS